MTSSEVVVISNGGMGDIKKQSYFSSLQISTPPISLVICSKSYSTNRPISSSFSAAFSIPIFNKDVLVCKPVSLSHPCNS